MMKKKYAASALLAAPMALLLSGCSVSDLMVDKYDESTEKSAKTSEEGVSSGLLPAWVPAGGTNVELVQRNTGMERIFAMDFTGDLPAEKCLPIKSAGHPSEAELKKAYASDPRTKDFDAKEISLTRTLEAQWWPQGAEDKTTELCGRFWVHLADGKLYAFAPDSTSTATAVLQERDAS
ncbi:hypothetical protein [Glutamicibacter sp. TV12E]|uniref:hypothetical protein n=1 Tax=Glutamicibacter sp. TV12E TaxID=3446362 RepID=UPI004034E0E4